MKLEDLIVYRPEKIPHNFIDRTGWENEYFKVVSRAPNGPKYQTRWNCLCKSCGEYCIKTNGNLEKHKSCGCQKKQNIGKALRKDLTGQRFGMLTALKYSGKSNSCGNAIWICKCDCGNICEVDSNNLANNHTLSCGCITSSIGADNIERILKENHFAYIKEYKMVGLYDKDKSHYFRLDFVIVKNNQPIRAIEFDGIQHYQETWGAWKTNISLKTQQDRDKRKNIWCINHNIPLVRIPYWERDNITLDMILSDKYLITK